VLCYHHPALAGPARGDIDLVASQTAPFRCDFPQLCMAVPGLLIPALDDAGIPDRVAARGRGRRVRLVLAGIRISG